MYTDKIAATKEIDSHIVKLATLLPMQKSLLLMKLSKAVLPSLGSLGDGMLSNDRSVMFASCFNILARNSTPELFDEMQQALLGGILGSDSEPLRTPERINDYLESKNLNLFDLLVWAFEVQLWDSVVNSQMFQQNKDKLLAIKDQFGDVLSLPNSEGEDTEVSQGVDTGDSLDDEQPE